MPKEKKILKYSQEDLLSAINEVKGGMSVKATAKKFGIPRVTLTYKWRKQISQWRIENTGKELKKKDFAPLLDIILKKMQPSIFLNGFKKCGLSPWNPEAISLVGTEPAKKQGVEDFNKTMEFINYLEGEIGQEKLDTFLNSNENEIQDISIEDLSLYKIWKRNKNVLEDTRASSKIPHKTKESNTKTIEGTHPRKETVTRREEEIRTEGHQEIELNEEAEQSEEAQCFRAHSEEVESSQCSQSVTSRMKYSNVNTDGSKEGVFQETNQETEVNIEAGQDNGVQASEVHTPEVCRSSGSITPKKKADDKRIETRKEWPFQEWGEMGNTGEEERHASEARTEEVVCQSSISVHSQKEDGSEEEPNVPSPFKRALFWPGTNINNKKGKRMRREKLPAVMSSPDAIEYYRKKEEDKENKEKEKMQKAEIRARKQKEKEEKKAVTIQRQKALKDTKSNENKKRKIEENDSTSTSASVSFDDDSDVSDEFPEIDDVSPYEEVDGAALVEGDFILCGFQGGKRNQTKFVYLCVIQEKRQDIEVMGLKSIDHSKKEYVLKENDISTITVDQVIGRLPQPQIICRGERISYLFKTALPVKEI